MDRRTFLTYSLAGGVMVWAGSAVPSALQPLFEAQAQTANLEVFPQSVGAGDPRANGIVLWTRALPRTRPSAATVSFQVATDANFGNVVLSGTAQTDPSRDYTVKVQLRDRSELRPATVYFYRFLLDGQSSPVGRFKTLPAPGDTVNRVNFAFVSCNDYTNGFFHAFRFLADEDIDFVVHLGDAIYETVFAPTFQNNRRPLELPSGLASAQSLEDYRALYRVYYSDPDYRRLRERHAFITIWDDHEYANDAYQEFNTDTDNPAQNRTPNRRQVASQAWAEYTAAAVDFNPSRDPLNAIQIYRNFEIGNLVELVVTDERLYRAAPPCGLNTALAPGCAAVVDPNRTMLGETQRRWFLDKMTQSPRTWKIWGNEVMTMQMKISRAIVNAAGVPGLTLPVDLFATLDQWDGYAGERAAIFNALRSANVRNFVTITGDLHTFIAGYQRLNFDGPLAPRAVPTDAVGVEFVTGSITASNLAEQPNPFNLDINTSTQLLSASNPHFQFFNSNTHGYSLVSVTPSELICTMKEVSTITEPNATLRVLKTYRVPNGQVLIQDITA